MDYLLYNPLANSNKGIETIQLVENDFPNISFIKSDITSIDLDLLLTSIKPNDTITLLGGDGTISIFSRFYQRHKVENPIYVYEGGSGNDFLNDVRNNEKRLLINKYLTHLPKVIVNGKEYYYVNGIGYGIDGMVCEVADEERAKGKKNINYTLIAIKLLLGKYKRPNATITVDGVTKKYKRVYLAAGMNGRFYGGGMMVAPDQNRLSGNLSLVVMFGKNRLGALIAFTGIFTGKLSRRKKICHTYVGKRIEVTFDLPTALQIDGEVIKNVTNYVAYYED